MLLGVVPVRKDLLNTLGVLHGMSMISGGDVIMVEVCLSMGRKSIMALRAMNSNESTAILRLIDEILCYHPSHRRVLMLESLILDWRTFRTTEKSETL